MADTGRERTIATISNLVGAQQLLKDIEVTANLQHPYILPLHESGEAIGFFIRSCPTWRARHFIGPTELIVFKEL